jgi:TonB-dependent starch-binding outer membrane protein SusC
LEYHKFNITAGLSAQKWGRPVESIRGLLASTLVPTLNNASELFIQDTYTIDENNHALASFFGRLSYDYKSKYLVAFTLRADGSSRFGPENSWGSFPSISGAWRFSDEPFMDNLNFINDAKLRASYAITGNERIGNQDYEVVLSTGNFYNGLNGVSLSPRLANPAIKWEETKQSNFGLDLSMLGGKVTVTSDLYWKNTYDLLANQPLPSETGLNDVRVNLGDIRNQGFEFSIQATVYDRRSLSWRTSFNFSTNSNKVMRLAGDLPLLSGNHITQVGNTIGSFYGYRIMGVFAYDQSNAFTPDGTQLTPNFDPEGNFTNYTLNGSSYTGEVKQISVSGNIPQGGDFYWKDNNGDFVIDGNDREILGNPYPKYFGGFRNEISYKNITFNFLFDYQFDVEVYNSFMQNLSQLINNAPTPPPYVLQNIWTGPGDHTALFPGGTRRVQNQLGTGTPTSNWVEKADFIKLRDIRLSYDFAKKLDMTVYASITNALVWTSYRGFDPEVSNTENALTSGVDNARYPRGREFILGLNVNF